MVFGIQSQYLPVFPLSQVVTMFTPRADTRGRPHRKPKRAGPRDARAQLSAPGAEAQPGTPAPTPCPAPCPPRGGGTYAARPLSGCRTASWSARCCCGRRGIRAYLLGCCSPARSAGGKGNRSRRDVSQREGQRRRPPREGETGHDRGSAGRSAGRGTRMLTRRTGGPRPQTKPDSERALSTRGLKRTRLPSTLKPFRPCKRTRCLSISPRLWIELFTTVQ